jgi:hypothetical protein
MYSCELGGGATNPSGVFTSGEACASLLRLDFSPTLLYACHPSGVTEAEFQVCGNAASLIRPSVFSRRERSEQ